MSKLSFCFIGEKDFVAPFRLTGADVYEFDPHSWTETEKRVEEGMYELIFVTESVSAVFHPKKAAVIVLPGLEGLFLKPDKTSKGYESLRQIIIKAVGMDILTE